MSRFTPTYTAEFEFQGDTIKGRFSRMKNRHLLALSPHLVVDESTPSHRRLALIRSAELIEAARDVLPECTLEFAGLKDSDGKELGIKDIVEEMYFLPLLDQLLERLMRESTLRGDDVKKSAAQPPADASGESASLTSLPGSSSEAGMTPLPDA